MHSHERVVRARRLARIRNLLVPLAHLSGAVVGRIVDCLAALNALLQIRRESLVGPIHVRPMGVPARGRQFKGVQDRRHWRRLDVRHVRVPDRLTVPQATNRCAVHLDIRDDVHFRKLGEE